MLGRLCWTVHCQVEVGSWPATSLAGAVSETRSVRRRSDEPSGAAWEFTRWSGRHRWTTGASQRTEPIALQSQESCSAGEGASVVRSVRGFDFEAIYADLGTDFIDWQDIGNTLSGGRIPGVGSSLKDGAVPRLDAKGEVPVSDPNRWSPVSQVLKLDNPVQQGSDQSPRYRL
jgi:hypothetical protein